jgi:biotin carboxyl carrier protein
VKYRIIVEGRTFEIEIGPGKRVWVNQEPLDVDLERVDGSPLFSLLVDNRSYETHVDEETDGECQVAVAGRSYRVCLQREQRPSTQTAHSDQGAGPTEVSAPLPGLMVEVQVVEGQQVEEGDVLAILESMKMHLELRAPCPGVVCAVCATAGQEVAQEEVLAVIEGS